MARCTWCENIPVLEDACEELMFWYQNTELLNGKLIWFSLGTTRIAYSHTSDSG